MYMMKYKIVLIKLEFDCCVITVYRDHAWAPRQVWMLTNKLTVLRSLWVSAVFLKISEFCQALEKPWWIFEWVLKSLWNLDRIPTVWVETGLQAYISTCAVQAQMQGKNAWTTQEMEKISFSCACDGDCIYAFHMCERGQRRPKQVKWVLSAILETDSNCACISRVPCDCVFMCEYLLCLRLHLRHTCELGLNMLWESM